MTQRTSNQENSLPTSNEQLYTCSCAEYYGSHHPECPARQQLDRLRAEVERLTAKLREEQELVEVNLSRMYDRALAYMRERDQLRAEVERLRSAPHCPTCGCGGAPA